MSNTMWLILALTTRQQQRYPLRSSDPYSSSQVGIRDCIFFVGRFFFGSPALNMLPSGKRLHNYGKSPCLMGSHPLFLSPFSIVIFDITRWYSFESNFRTVNFWVKKMGLAMQGASNSTSENHQKVHHHFLYTKNKTTASFWYPLVN